MNTVEIIAQTVSVLGMACNVLSFQQKTQKRVITCQLAGASLFTVSYLLLGAYVGALLNFVAIIRAIVYMHKEKFRSEHISWLIGFTTVYLLSYLLTFTVFDKDFTLLNAVIEFLPIIGMFATTVSFRLKDAASVRKLGLIYSVPSWLIYNIFNFSIGGIICEIFCGCSILIGMIRLDRKKKE